MNRERSCFVHNSKGGNEEIFSEKEVYDWRQLVEEKGFESCSDVCRA